MPRSSSMAATVAVLNCSSCLDLVEMTASGPIDRKYCRIVVAAAVVVVSDAFVVAVVAVPAVTAACQAR